MSTPFEVTILGCSSATPTSKRFPSAQLLQAAGRFFLIDCGEAAQIQLRRYHIRFQRINHIFISHLHGDHYLGLMGLLQSLHLLGRKNPLHLYHPPGLKEIIDVQLLHSDTRLNYEIIYHEHRFDEPALLYEDQLMTVHTILLNHRIPCCGFLFREKQRPWRVNRAKMDELGVPLEQIGRIKDGEDVELENGTVIPHSLLHNGRPTVRSYAYCSDTIFDKSVIEQIKGVDAVYHEATFLHEMLDRAQATYHTTALQAGQVAQEAGAGQLIIGHYSARYVDLQPLLQEARSVFPNTILAEEGLTFPVVEQASVQKIE